MLKHRIIPILLYDGKFCVHTKQFKAPARRLGPITQFVENMANRDVDELVLLDINASKEFRRPNFKQIKEFTEKLFCPVAYGGGVRTLNDISRLIQECGVDKVIIGMQKDIVYMAARKFGSQSIVYALDVSSDKTAFGWPKGVGHTYAAKLIEGEGAGELLVTSISNQGLENGYNVLAIDEISSTVNIPIIANGGCGSASDMEMAIRLGASAVAASTMFALRGVTPQDCARALSEAGLPVRLSTTGQT